MMDLGRHFTDSEFEAEDGPGNRLMARNASQWFACVSQDPEKLVSEWMRALQTFFLENPCEVCYSFWPVRCHLVLKIPSIQSTEIAAVWTLRELREVGKKRRF